MPTKRPRHSITETPPVEAALAPLRAAGIRFDLSDLVVRGAAQKLREADEQASSEEQRAGMRRRFLERSRTGQGIDRGALDAVHDHGWTH